jgi:hypothetical protein
MNKLTVQFILNIIAIVGVFVAIIFPPYWAASNILISISMFFNSYNYYQIKKQEKFYIYVVAGILFLINAAVL